MKGVRSCNKCHVLKSKKGEPLKHCAKCTTLYCSRECQTADWKSHKLVCPGQKSKSTSDQPEAKRSHNPTDTTENRLSNGMLATLLRALGNMKGTRGFWDLMTEEEVYAEMIDSFRTRVEDEFILGRTSIGLHATPDPRPAFRHYLKLAESRRKILPAWWNAGKRKECEKMAANADSWSNIYRMVKRDDITAHYNSDLMILKLRIVGEQVYGSGGYVG